VAQKGGKVKPGDTISNRSDFRGVRSLEDLRPGELVAVDARCRQYLALDGALIVAEVLEVGEGQARLDLGGPELVVHRTYILRRIP
jgi:hypothetical protein